MKISLRFSAKTRDFTYVQNEQVEMRPSPYQGHDMQGPRAVGSN
jgi:hypothetical protein